MRNLFTINKTVKLFLVLGLIKSHFIQTYHLFMRKIASQTKIIFDDE